MRGSPATQILAWTAGGTGVEFLMLMAPGDVGSYPVWGWILCGGTELLYQGLRSLDLGLRGDVRFVLILVAMVLRWMLIGFVIGVGRAGWCWWRSRECAVGASPGGGGNPEPVTRASESPVTAGPRRPGDNG